MPWRPDIRGVTITLAVLGVGGCIDAGTTIEPGKDRLTFLVISQTGRDPAVEFRGPFDLRNETPTFSIPPDGGAVHLVSWSDQALLALDPRVNLEQLATARIDPSSEALRAEALCRSAGIPDEGASRGGPGHLELPLERALPEATIQVVAAGSGELQPIDDVTLVPVRPERLSLRAPVAPCLDGWSIELERFAPAEGDLDPDGPGSLAEVEVLDTNHVVVLTGAHLGLVRRGESRFVSRVDLSVWPIDEDEFVVLEGLAVDARRWPETARAYFAARMGTQMDGPDPDNDPDVLAVRVYEAEFNLSGFSTPRLIQHVDREPSVRTVIRYIGLSPENELMVLGKNFAMTSTSAGSQMRVIEAPDEDFFQMAWTGDPTEPHVLVSRRGQVYVGDLYDGLASMRVDRLTRTDDTSTSIEVSDDGTTWSMATDPQFFTRRAPSGEWTEHILGMPLSAQPCVSGRPLCGRRDLALEGANSLFRVASIRVPDGRTLFVMAPTACSALVLFDPDAHCAIATPIYGDRIASAPERGSFDQAWEGLSGIVAGSPGLLLEARLVPPE